MIWSLDAAFSLLSPSPAVSSAPVWLVTARFGQTEINHSLQSRGPSLNLFAKYR